MRKQIIIEEDIYYQRAQDQIEEGFFMEVENKKEDDPEGEVPLDQPK